MRVAAGKQTTRREEEDGKVYKESPEIKRLWPFLGGGGKTNHLLGRARVAQDEDDEEHGSHVGRRVYNQWCPGGHIGNPG
jgi:hypothetical protein